MQKILIIVFIGYSIVGSYYFVVLSADFISHKGFLAYLLLGELVVTWQAMFWPFQLL